MTLVNTYLLIDKCFVMTDEIRGKAAEILDAAERRIRCGGFDSVSFRDLAADVGIKSASVHYHFPQKANLGEAVVERYGERFIAALGDPDDPKESAKTRIKRLCEAYRISTLDQGMICLCSVLGSATLELPPQVSRAVVRFFHRLMEWTDRALEDADGVTSALGPPSAGHIIASLQGTVILALTLEKPSLFAETQERLLRDLA